MGLQKRFLKRTTLGDTNERQRKALADAVAGVLASLVSLWSFFPIDTYKIQCQANTTSSSSSSSSTGLYRGMGIKTMHTASSSFCYFYIYSWISSRYNGKGASTMKRLVLSAMAAMLNTLLTLPLDVLSAKQQASSKSPKTMDEVWKESKEASDETTTDYQEEKKDDIAPSEASVRHDTPPLSNEKKSLTRLWKGLYPSLLLCSNPSIHYTVFDSIKSRLLLQNQQEANLTMAQAFVVGLFAKFVATMATYPLIRTKVLLMVTSQTSMTKCLQQEFQKYGIIKGWYHGCHLQLFHTLLKSALLMMVRERITITTQRLLVPSNDR